MNSRIRELAIAADAWCDQSVALHAGTPLYNNLWEEKFAELIVRECMSINTQRLFSDYEGDTHRVAHNNALWCAWGDMQEHFGIEE
jgi:hypothetical protein